MKKQMQTTQTDFSKGTIPRNILRLAVPMILAQLINVLYSVVDRMYIGHLPDASCRCPDGYWHYLSDYFNCHGFCQSFWNGRFSAVFN